MSGLRISSNLILPEEAVTQTFGIMAKRGSGKTYTAAVLAEEMLKANLAKMKITGGTFAAYYGRLKREGYIEESGVVIEPLDKAFNMMGRTRGEEHVMTPYERQQMWRDVLPGGSQAMLDYLIVNYPRAATRLELAEVTGYAESGGTFATYVGHLRRNGLVTIENSLIKADAGLFKE
jgi:hypothetical protein